MKKKNQPSKRTRNMTTKFKHNKSSLDELVSEYVVKVLSSVLNEDDIDSVRSALQENSDGLQNVIVNNIPKQKTEKKTEKKKKDSNAPKRGKSSYIFFCVDKREEIKKANPNMSAKDIIRELGRVWREDTSESDRAKYESQSIADKKRYDNEMIDYAPKNLTNKKSKDNNIKRPKSAYIFFCMENRPIIKQEYPELATHQITSTLGKKWKSISDKEKKRYTELAENDKVRYAKEKGDE